MPTRRCAKNGDHVDEPEAARGPHDHRRALGPAAKDGKPPPRHGDFYDRGPPRYDDRSDQRGSFGGAGGGNSRAQASSDVATRNLFVGNIPPDATESDVMAHFGKYGDVAAVKFLPKKSDTFAAFVDFHNVEHARDAHDSSNMLGGMSSAPITTSASPPPAAARRPSRGYDDEYDRGYDRAPPPPPRYDERPPPRYDDRYDDRRGGYDDRAPPPPRADDRDRRRRGTTSGHLPRYDDRYDDRRGGAAVRRRRRRVMTTVLLLLRGTTSGLLLVMMIAATTTVGRRRHASGIIMEMTVATIVARLRIRRSRL